MSEPSYQDPPVHRASLEQRLRNICRSLGINELRTRTSLAHTVVAQMLPDGVVKGGAAIKLRVGDHASRLTTDLDTARGANHTVESYTTELADRLAEGWYGFTGRLVEREPADPPEIPAEYVMQPFDVKLAYNGQSYVTVLLEMGHDEVGSTEQPRLALDSGIAEVIEGLGFPAPAPIPVLAVEHQIAQKLHAVSEPGSERVRDLIDLQLLDKGEDLDFARVNATCVRLFEYRRQQAWPPTIELGAGWDTLYEAVIEDVDVLPDAEAAVAWVNDLVRRIVGGT